ncbi:MAG: hypothetical protein R3E67_03150 [Pseudomonadales bacterium]
MRAFFLRNTPEHQSSLPRTIENWRRELRAQYADFQQRKLALDLTRGKPSAEQLALSDALDGNLHAITRWITPTRAITAA